MIDFVEIPSTREVHPVSNIFALKAFAPDAAGFQSLSDVAKKFMRLARRQIAP
ncbi:MAG: hypothetical protein ABWZ64_16010 [Xanthobacteraceae bacterium]